MASAGPTLVRDQPSCSVAKLGFASTVRFSVMYPLEEAYGLSLLLLLWPCYGAVSSAP